MAERVHIRPYRSAADARPQYQLWLAATEGLPRPWRSCLRNVQHQLEATASRPRGRLYAERADGSLAGYIGVHPPFEWDPEAHGPPGEKLGWAIPFGFPWTCPEDPELAARLYDEMDRSIPEVFADHPRDIYIQRFRESWDRQIEFVTERGWRLLKRLPLLGCEIEGQPLPADLRLVAEDDIGLLAELSSGDPTADTVSVEQLASIRAGGWVDFASCWRLGERGAFALEPRGHWAAVTVFFALPDAWQETIEAAAAQAAHLGASEMYFTIDEHQTKLREALTARGFSEVDAGVYYVRDAR